MLRNMDKPLLFHHMYYGFIMVLSDRFEYLAHLCEKVCRLKEIDSR